MVYMMNKKQRQELKKFLEGKELEDITLIVPENVEICQRLKGIFKDVCKDKHIDNNAIYLFDETACSGNLLANINKNTYEQNNIPIITHTPKV